MKKDLYVFLGPPGSGKGSLSSLCTKKLGWKQLSTGNMCRCEIGCGSSVGQQMDLLIKSGKLVPNNLIVTMIENALMKSTQDLAPVILDGFPRTFHQAEELDKLVKKEPFCSFRIKVVRMCILADTLIKRLTNRVICSNKDCQAVYSRVDLALGSRKAMVCDLCSAQLAQRDDDTIIVAQKRLDHYYVNERDIVDYFKQKGWDLFDLEVGRSIDEVFVDFVQVVGVAPEPLS